MHASYTPVKRGLKLCLFIGCILHSQVLDAKTTNNPLEIRWITLEPAFWVTTAVDADSRAAGAGGSVGLVDLKWRLLDVRFLGVGWGLRDGAHVLFTVDTPTTNQAVRTLPPKPVDSHGATDTHPGTTSIIVAILAVVAAVANLFYVYSLYLVPGGLALTACLLGLAALPASRAERPRSDLPVIGITLGMLVLAALAVLRFVRVAAMLTAL